MTVNADDYMNTMHIIFVLTKPFSKPSCPVDRGEVILEETIHTRIEMFQYKTNVIGQKKVLILRSVTLKGRVEPNHGSKFIA